MNRMKAGSMQKRVQLTHLIWNMRLKITNVFQKDIQMATNHIRK